MNFSFFFRLMDHWGLPRTIRHRGGRGRRRRGRAMRRIAGLLPGRFFRKAPRLVRLQLHNLATIARADGELARLDGRIAAARGSRSSTRVSVEALALAIRTNFAINGVLSGVSRLRRFARRPRRRGAGDDAAR